MFNVYLDDLKPGPNNDYLGVPYPQWETWVIVRSVENVKKLLELGLVNNLSLDHDMGLNSETFNENPNGSDLVKWMIESGVWPKGIITIHSQNIGKAKEMKSDIDKFRPPF